MIKIRVIYTHERLAFASMQCLFVVVAFSHCCDAARLLMANKQNSSYLRYSFIVTPKQHYFVVHNKVDTTTMPASKTTPKQVSKRKSEAQKQRERERDRLIEAESSSRITKSRSNMSTMIRESVKYRQEDRTRFEVTPMQRLMKHILDEKNIPQKSSKSGKQVPSKRFSSVASRYLCGLALDRLDMYLAYANYVKGLTGHTLLLPKHVEAAIDLVNARRTTTFLIPSHINLIGQPKKK